MAEDTESTRVYRSPLRERHAAQTRELILRAVADEIVDGGLHGLSVAAVAARADIAERTVYRHFANVEAMLSGLRAWADEQMGDRMEGRRRLGADADMEPDDLVAGLPGLYAAFDAIGTPMRAIAMVALAQGDDPGRSKRRDELHRKMEAELTHLDDVSAYAVTETMHLLAGLLSWYLLTRDGTLSSEQAGEAAGRVMRAALAGLRAERDATTPRRSRSRAKPATPRPKPATPRPKPATPRPRT